jgi:hypothetical protein
MSNGCGLLWNDAQSVQFQSVRENEEGLSTVTKGWDMIISRVFLLGSAIQRIG